MKTRWKPVDLVCREDDEEFTVRTKLARDAESTGVCIAEAVSHALLLASGFRMADAFCVVIGEEFARDLSAQYRFGRPVRPGRHWGTRLMRRGVQEVEFSTSLVDELADPPDLFRLYLADVILGNPDRKTHGNVLLARTAAGAGGFDLIPIDQSDAFFHPSAMIDPPRLQARFDDLGAEMLEGTERVLLEGGTSLVETCFSEAATLEADVSRFSKACHDEWFDGAGVDPSLLEGFLVHRIRKLAVLARKDHWRRVASLNPGGEYAFDLS